MCQNPNKDNFIRVYDNNLTYTGKTQKINDLPKNTSDYIVLANLDDGGLVACYWDANEKIKIQIFDSNFSKVGANILVSPFITEDGCSITGLLNNNFVVLFQNTTRYYFASIYNSTGSIVRGPFQVTQKPCHFNATLTTLIDGNFLFAYYDSTSSSFKVDKYSQDGTFIIQENNIPWVTVDAAIALASSNAGYVLSLNDKTNSSYGNIYALYFNWTNNVSQCYHPLYYNKMMPTSNNNSNATNTTNTTSATNASNATNQTNSTNSSISNISNSSNASIGSNSSSNINSTNSSNTSNISNVSNTNNTSNLTSIAGYLYWNGSIIENCSYPLLAVSNSTGNFCIYSCDVNQYLYFNGSCLLTCPNYFTSNFEGGRNFCQYKCSNLSLIYDNTSLGCVEPSISISNSFVDSCSVNLSASFFPPNEFLELIWNYPNGITNAGGLFLTQGNISMTQFTIILTVYLINNNNISSSYYVNFNTSGMLTLNTPSLPVMFGEDLSLTINYGCMNLNLLYNTISLKSGNFAWQSNFPNQSSVVIPACTLSPNQTYYIDLNSSYLELNISKNITIYTTPLEIIGNIQEGLKMYPYDLNLTLHSSFLMRTSCNLNQPTSYVWNCITSNGSSCNDKLTINSLQKITIQNGTFAVDDLITFEVIFVLGNSQSSARTSIQFGPSSTIDLNIECSQQNCMIYSPTDYLFLFGITGNYKGNVNDLEFFWQLSPNFPIFTYQNVLKISPILLGVQSSELNVSLSVLNKKYLSRGYINLTIPINSPPIAGSLNVIPTYGFALQTSFNLIVNGSFDIDSPLECYFYYSTDHNVTWNSLNNLNSSFTISTILPLPNSQNNIVNIKALVKDSLRSESYLFGAAFLNFSTNSSLNILNLVQRYSLNSNTTLVDLNMATNSLQNLYSYNSFNQICNPCQNVSCNSTLDPCNVRSISSNLVKSLASFNSSTRIEDNNLLLKSLLDITNVPNYNTTLQDLLQLIIKSQNATKATVSSSTNSLLIAKVLSSLLDVTSASDCTSSSDFSQNLLQSSDEILSSISDSLQASKLPNENASLIVTKNFDMLSGIYNECNLNNQTFSAGANSPSITFTQKSSANCSSLVSMSYFAFNDKLFTCDNTSSTNITKGRIMVDIKDVNSQISLIEEYAAKLIMPIGLNCPLSCVEKPKGSRTCDCNKLDIFDVKSQLVNLFANSNLNKVNFTNFSEWEFYSDPIFWILISLLLWYLATYFYMKKYDNKHCDLQNYKYFNDRSMKQALIICLKMNHPLLCIYYFVFKESSKFERATLYISRIFSMLLFVTLFKTDSNRKLGDIINPYLILLPYVTFIPIYSILAYGVQNPTKMYLESQKPNIRKIIAKVALGVMITGSILVMFLVASNQKSSDKIPWVIQFSKVMIQDTFITPFIFTLLQYSIFKIFSNTTGIKKKFFGFLLEEKSGQVFSLVNSKANGVKRLFKRHKNSWFG